MSCGTVDYPRIRRQLFWSKSTPAAVFTQELHNLFSLHWNQCMLYVGCRKIIFLEPSKVDENISSPSVLRGQSGIFEL